MVDDVTIPETMHIETPVVEEGARQTIEREAEGGVIETVERPLSAREQAMLEIAANRKKAIAKELHYGEDLADRAREDAGQEALAHERLDVDPEAEPEPGAAEPAPKPAAVKPAAPPPAPEPQTQAQQQRIITLPNGQQHAVTEEQLAQLAAIGAVALEASRRAPEQPQQPQQQVQRQQPQPQQQAPQQAPRQVLTPEESQALSRRIQYGNDQESAAALQDMTQLMAARLQAAYPQVNPQRIAEYATQQAMQRIQQQNELNWNLQTLGNEFPDVFGDKTLAQLAALKLHEIRQTDQLMGIQKPDLTAYREAAAAVRSAVFKNAQPVPQPTLEPALNQQPSQASQEQAQQGRFEAKRAAPRSPQPAQRTLASPAESRRFPTNSEIVRQMQKSRGQVV
jgi:hypothetical protein